MRRTSIIWLCVVAIALLSACAQKPVPDYQARRLGSDEKVSLASLRGEVVLLNVWATWCVPCREEMPAFERLYRRYRDRGLRIVGVNVDEGRGDASVEQFVQGLGITFEIWRDPESRVRKRFRTLGMPETLLINRNGETVKHWRGRMDPTAAENLESIDKALGLPAADAQRNSPKDPVQVGWRLAEQRDCRRCHSFDGRTLEGPSFKGVAGTQVRLADGRTVVRDRAYLARAISDPDAEIVAGYRPGLMTSAMLGRPLTAAEVDALVAFITSLSTER